MRKNTHIINISLNNAEFGLLLPVGQFQKEFIRRPRLWWSGLRKVTAMPVISDLELKKRLEAHNYQVPPITESTKKVLLKKLIQLDKEANNSKASKLHDYSSAEEDGTSANPSPHLRRRKVNPTTTNATSTNGSGRSSQRTTAPSTQNRRKNQLVQISDEEDEEEEEESNQTSESEDDDDDDDEQETMSENIGLQTSFNSTLHSPPSPINGKSSSNTNGARRSQRFANHSPASPVRSTASYLNSQAPVTSTPMAFPPNSPLRKAVAKNASAFGSLGRSHIYCSSFCIPAPCQ